MAKVLIVDDEPHIRILLERILEAMEDEGLEIFSAGQGNDAWQIIHSQHPELVFLDIVMPDMSGFELCRRIKQELDPAGIHVVLLTARGQESDREKGKQAGADGYITKPFNPSLIVKYTRQVLNLEG